LAAAALPTNQPMPAHSDIHEDDDGFDDVLSEVEPAAVADAPSSSQGHAPSSTATYPPSLSPVRAFLQGQQQQQQLGRTGSAASSHTSSIRPPASGGPAQAAGAGLSSSSSSRRGTADPGLLPHSVAEGAALASSPAAGLAAAVSEEELQRWNAGTVYVERECSVLSVFLPG
jgi:hypothetical protein